jgi:peptidoglycan/LPS O-acetylase OafA/YrhL
MLFQRIANPLQNVVNKIHRGVDWIIDNRATTGDQFIGNFDGLRAIAALMVLAMHLRTIPGLALGAPGVWIFFTLSGFLLYTSFLRSSEETNSTTIVAYLVRRVFRIMPLYIVFIYSYAFLYKGWSPDFKQMWFLAHTFFLSGNLHLWTIRTEIVFYVFLPVLVLLLLPIRSHNLRFVTLCCLAVVSWYVFETRLLSVFRGNDFYAPFLLGMAAVHIYERVPPRLAMVVAYAAMTMIVLLSTFEPWTEPLRQLFGIGSRVTMYGNGAVFYPLCFLLVLSVSRFQSRIFGNRWLRLLGVCGYGIYLWHPLTIELVRDWGIEGHLYQLVCYLLNFALAIATYLVIEKPGIDLGKRISRWVRDGRPALRVIRPVWICLLVITTFIAVRQSYLVENKIEFHVEMWSSQQTVTKIYLKNRGYYSEERTAVAPIAAKSWQTLYLPLADQPVRGIRFDPGEADGEYRVRRILAKFPMFAPVPLDLQSFRPHLGISSVSHENGHLTVYAEPGHGDPILIYNGTIPQVATVWTFTIIAAGAGALLLVLVFSLIDGLIRRMSWGQQYPA